MNACRRNQQLNLHAVLPADPSDSDDPGTFIPTFSSLAGQDAYSELVRVA